jgi:hypothetical protein
MDGRHRRVPCGALVRDGDLLMRDLLMCDLLMRGLLMRPVSVTAADAA